MSSTPSPIPAEVLNQMSETDRIRALELLTELDHRNTRAAAQKDFIKFVERMWPEFIPGRHHAKMARAFEKIAQGKLKRLIINMPPRHTKSEFASYLLPAWFLGLYPNKQIMQISHTADMAEGFGRKVRNLVDSDNYHTIFPDTRLRRDSTAAARWNTDKNGTYIAMGVGGAVAGKGADICIIDDPISEQEGKSNNPEPFNAVYDYYMTGPRQRLQPGGAIVIVMCMTGDTNVLMADGTNTHLKNIRVGDKVATFDKGRLSVSKINNWQSSGIDSIYTIQTQSGIILRANERHPFLVLNEGVLEWTRLRTLKPGMLLVTTKDAKDQHGHKLNQVCVTHAKQGSVITKRTLTHPIKKLDFTENTKVNNVVLKDVLNQPIQTICVNRTAEKRNGLLVNTNVPQKKIEKQELKVDTELQSKTTTVCMMSKKGNAQYATNFLEKMSERIGVVNYVSTIVTTQEKLEHYSATTATSQLDMERQSLFSKELQLISDFTTDPIISITFSGKEEVFDVEVDCTENFIANGVVSHNTRWNKRDLTGRLVENMISSPDGDQWEVIEFPAVLPSGKPLWPEFWPLEELEKTRLSVDVRFWNAQYLQNPTSEEGAIIKRDWWKRWDNDRPPEMDYLLMSWDTAFEKHNRADFSALTVWGVFEADNDDGTRQPNIMLLDAVKKRVEFPELKEWVKEAYDEWAPDTMIVEKRASGMSLIQELRRMGIPVHEFTPARGNDKISRLHSIADIFSSGFVWAPNYRWADELVDDVAAFPSGMHDDLVDTVSQALIFFRNGNFVRTILDEPEEEKFYRRKREYY